MLRLNGLVNYYSNCVNEYHPVCFLILSNAISYSCPLIALTTQIIPIHSSPLALSVSALEISALQFWLQIPPFVNSRFPLYSIVKKKKTSIMAAAALPCAVGSPVEVQLAFTALLSCLVNPLREHEYLRKKGGKKITKPVIL